jgi:hypothetical protein
MCLSRLVAMTLEKIITDNLHRHVLKPQLILNDVFVKFQSSYEPDVSVEYYVQRIFKHSKCSDSCLIIMLVYIDRLIESQGLVLTMLNAHRVIITSLMVAAKYHDDLFYNNAYFAKLGGIPLSELNMLEVEFLQMLNFSMFVDALVFEKYQIQLQNFQAYVQSQYSPRSTACHPVGSPYHHQCENAFQFSPLRFATSEPPQFSGFYVPASARCNSNSPPLVEFAPSAFIFPACRNTFPSPETHLVDMHSSQPFLPTVHHSAGASIWPSALTTTVTTTQPPLVPVASHPISLLHHPHSMPVPLHGSTISLPATPIMLVTPVPMSHPHSLSHVYSHHAVTLTPSYSHSAPFSNSMHPLAHPHHSLSYHSSCCGSHFAPALPTLVSVSY